MPISLRPPVAAGAALASGLVLFACGSGSDFAAEADGICTEQAVRVNRVLDDGGTPGSASETAAQTATLLPIERDAVRRLRRVEASEGATGEAYRGFVAGRVLALRLSERRARAARRRAGASYAAIGARRERIVKKADAGAARAGLLACAERLSRGASRAVEAAITEIATRPDPALCEELFTANFVRSEFGDPGRCRRRQRQPRGAARSVEIAALRGIDGVYALATILPHGGDSGGRRMQLGMLYEGGAYRADSLAKPGG